MRAKAPYQPPAEAPGRLPDFLIVGAMKSGTSTLRAYLDAHPEVFCAREQHFFNLHFDRGADWYRQRFAAAGAKRLLGEKCPEYLHNPVAAERMGGLLPDARLIVLLRDPVERAYSHYWHERRTGRETLSFAQALAAEPERRSAKETRYAYVERGRYLSQLQRIDELYPRERVLVLLFEDLRDDPAGTFAAVCRFLGVDDTFSPSALGEVRNPYRTYRPRWLFKLLTNQQRWKRLPPRFASWIGRRMTRRASYQPMDESIRGELQARFKEDNRALASWLGRDLAAWSS
jgi:sulfotransferase family protein